jgi:predicted transcriptional regulator
MVQAYNFLGSWQLFPEKGTYESGLRPKSGYYKIESPEEKRELMITHSWVSLENEAFNATYRVIADGDIHPFSDKALADDVQVSFIDSITFELHFYRAGQVVLHIVHEIQPNGYLKLTVQGFREEGATYTNIEIFHKQMSVLPYSASVSGALIKPTEEGVIRHKALTAMEEQTNMQLEQIRKQIELLALQAQEIHKRKELSMLIYSAKISFKPEIGQVYYLYEKQDGSHIISMISPKEWGEGLPYKACVASVQLLADHTWKEL